MQEGAEQFQQRFRDDCFPVFGRVLDYSRPQADSVLEDNLLSEASAVSRLKRLLDELHPRLFPKQRRRRITSPETMVRSEAVSRLITAINEVEKIAQGSPYRTRKGAGGIPAKARWYQLMGYLVQVLDGVLRNVDLERYEEKMEELEKTVEELQRTGQQA